MTRQLFGVPFFMIAASKNESEAGKLQKGEHESEKSMIMFD
jgi:hypothetical protein